jgi:membrane associated rhomboid family serine protease
MGAFLVTFPQDRIRSLLVIFVFVRVAYVPAALLIGVWGLIQFLSLGAISQQPSGGGVAYAAHVGGFIFGTVAARLFTRGRNDPKLELAQ